MATIPWPSDSKRIIDVEKAATNRGAEACFFVHEMQGFCKLLKFCRADWLDRHRAEREIDLANTLAEIILILGGGRRDRLVSVVSRSWSTTNNYGERHQL